MNGYDFDKTIYPGDSATHFFWWCARRYPAALSVLPRAGLKAVIHARDREIHGALKETIYSFLRFVPDVPAEVGAFWDRNINRIYPWYLSQRRADDVIISASPAFLVGEACRRLGVKCIATDMDPATGRLRSRNCRAGEKVQRYRAVCGSAPLESFYSDSYSDRPMMDLAEHAYLMKNGALSVQVK